MASKIHEPKIKSNLLKAKKNHLGEIHGGIYGWCKHLEAMTNQFLWLHNLQNPGSKQVWVTDSSHLVATVFQIDSFVPNGIGWNCNFPQNPTISHHIPAPSSIIICWFCCFCWAQPQPIMAMLFMAMLFMAMACMPGDDLAPNRRN